MTAARLVRHGIQKTFNIAILGLMLAMLASLSIVAVETNLDDLEVAGRSSRTALNCDELMPKGSSTRSTVGAHDPGGPGSKADVSSACALLLPTVQSHGAPNPPTASIAAWPSIAPTFGARQAGAAGARGPPVPA